jgi:hypothetical protein
MNASLLRSRACGKFFKLTYDDQPIRIPLEKCLVVRGVYDKYVRLDLSKARGNKQDLVTIHEYIQRKISPSFSPLKYAAENGSWTDVVCKISNAQWQPFEKEVHVGNVVDVVLTVRTYAKFGWVLTVQEIYL